MKDIFLHTHNNLKNVKNMERENGELTVSELAELKKNWAFDLLGMLNVDLKVIGPQPEAGPSLLVGNHLSYIDIPLIMAVSDAVFVAKREVGNWPLVGRAAKVAGTIFVKRSCRESRKSAGQQITEQAIQNKRNVVVFPSGTTSIRDESPWRLGAFRIANEFDLKVQPFRIWYEPIRDAAYVNSDFLPMHLFNLLAHRKVQAFIEYHEPVKITDPVQDMEFWQNWSREPTFRSVAMPRFESRYYLGGSTLQAGRA